MSSIGIIANSDNKETIAQVIQFLNSLSDFKVVYIKQSNKKLYVVTDKVFNPYLEEADQ